MWVKLEPISEEEGKPRGKVAPEIVSRRGNYDRRKRRRTAADSDAHFLKSRQGRFLRDKGENLV